MEPHPLHLVRWVVIGLIGVFVIALGWWLIFARPTPVQKSAGNPSLPTAGSATSTMPAGPTLALAANGGGLITVTDFIRSGLAGEDPQNPGTYYLFGTPGYCLKNGQCPGTSLVSPYNLTYDANKQTFTIVLLTEPLGAVRLQAEQFLLTHLGITQVQACRLKYFIGTIDAVNQQYEGVNLGMSFCSGATKLPQ